MKIRFSTVAMPRRRHVPGCATRADMDRLDPVTASVPDRMAPDEVAPATAFRFGVDLYNEGYFWEAHEVWEPVWQALPPNSCARSACQALIQGANALLKLRTGQRRAFLKLVDEALRHAREARTDGDRVCGVDIGRWAGDLETLAQDGTNARPVLAILE